MKTIKADEYRRDNRLLVLFLFGAIILAVGRYKVLEQDVQPSRYYATASTGQGGSKLIRVHTGEAGQGGLTDLIGITSDLSCAETPPEFALFFNLPLPVNRADQDTLTILPGIGPKLAEKIIAFREGQGDISGPEDFICIKGIGPKLTERLTSLLCFAGTEQKQ